MKYSEITEAPIGNLEVYDMDQPGTFPDADRKLLTNPAHLQKIKRNFELNTFDFDMYFINQPDVSYTYPIPYDDDPETKFKRPQAFTDRWYEDLEDYAGLVSPDILDIKFGMQIRPNPDAITVVYLSNANEENSIPMTPWIVAHRFAHSLTDNKKSLTPELTSALREIPDRFSNLAPHHPMFNGVSFNLLTLMTNRSARLGIMSEEYKEEMIAQYLITGSVKLAYPESKPLPDGIDRTMVNNQVRGISNRMTVAIDHIMDRCVGHIFIAV